MRVSVAPLRRLGRCASVSFREHAVGDLALCSDLVRHEGPGWVGLGEQLSALAELSTVEIGGLLDQREGVVGQRAQRRQVAAVPGGVSAQAAGRWTRLAVPQVAPNTASFAAHVGGGPYGAVTPLRYLSGSTQGAPMSDIVGEHEDIRGAFERPTLTLLNRPDRQVTFAVLRLSFTRETGGVAAPVLHRRVEEHLSDLAAIGVDVPRFDGQIDGKATCRRWLDAGALKKERDPDGQDVYFQSSELTEGLSLINQMTRDRSGLSEHRIATIMAAVAALNLRINPDVGERIRILESEVAERQVELERLRAGGEIEPVDDDYVIDGFDNLLRLFGALPGDFRRVIDRMVDQRRMVIQKFQSETGRIGDHLVEYLDMADALMTETPEGRAFLGAQDLLRDNPARLEFRRNIEDLLANPQAGLLSETERRDLKNLLILMEQGFGSVLDARSAITGMLREQILTRNVDREVAMERALRSLEAAVTFSFEVGRAQDKIECDVLPQKNELTSVPQFFHDPADDLPPEPLPVRKARAANPSAFAELMKKGGPSLIDLRRAIVAAADAHTGGALPTVGEVFESLPASLRRPVEVIGMLYLADAISKDHHESRAATQLTTVSAGSPDLSPALDSDLSSLVEGVSIPSDLSELQGLAGPAAGTREVFRCVRPDGTEVSFLGPRVRLDTRAIEKLRENDSKIGASR
jgi:hypothetical protein